MYGALGKVYYLLQSDDIIWLELDFRVGLVVIASQLLKEHIFFLSCCVLILHSVLFFFVFWL